MFLTVANGFTVETTSFTTARNSGSPAVWVLLWTRTISVCGSDWKPASRRIVSARWAWPTLELFWSICLVPIAWPIITAAITKASQPNTAVFQWLALHRPIRAAMLLDFFRGDMARLSLLCGFRLLPSAASQRRPVEAMGQAGV